MKLPAYGSKPKSKSTPFELLNPGGDEVFKVKQRYPTVPGQRRCKIQVFWKGGPPGCQVYISLADMKNWVCAQSIATVANVPPGEVGRVTWKIPAKFQPTDDCPTTSVFPQYPGQYCIYIADTQATTWTYGPLFTIVWSE
ncbi:MAG: hypothetical protein R6X13_05655 [bacterium]